MIFVTNLDSTTLYGYLGILATSLVIGLGFLYLHFYWQKKYYNKKKTWKFNDNNFNKIIDWLKRNIFSLFAFIFLFTVIAIIFLLISSTIFKS